MEEHKQLTLHIYPSGEGESLTQLYSDAGDGYGSSPLDTLHLVRFADNLELRREEQGDYPFLYTSVKLHLHGLKIQQAWVDDVDVTSQGQELDYIECDRFFKIRLQID
ncbi:alpha-glucosidase [Calothrix brevissima NIES-22]|nr:alpha-glucosidase [Calothrix brevissima NIES-22]